MARGGVTFLKAASANSRDRDLVFDKVGFLCGSLKGHGISGRILGMPSLPEGSLTAKQILHGSVGSRVSLLLRPIGMRYRV